MVEASVPLTFNLILEKEKGIVASFRLLWTGYLNVSGEHVW